ncbi:MAG: ligase-associated DNA damage response exonuclease [Gemmatimonadota bacterium]
MPLLVLTDSGLYCEAGDFFIDPWRPVERAVVTHAHGDHLRSGSRHYIMARAGARIAQTRLGEGAPIVAGVEYGDAADFRGVRVTLFPAGHILGSAQVRIEHHGEVWVVSGDYKTEPDPTCAPFEPIRCHTFITESTFGLPIYRWRPQAEIFADIDDWWRLNRDAGRSSVLFGYALGKAQRLLAGVDTGIGPIYTHGATETMVTLYRESGIALPPTLPVNAAPPRTDWSSALILAPPGTESSPWMRRFGDSSTAFASGWMQVRGARRRRSLDRGFALSDHVDWPGLLSTIEATGAEKVLVTHGFTQAVVRYLTERGIGAEAIATRFEGDEVTEDSEPPA